MSTTINTGWLKDNNGDKFAPKTLTSQVQTSDGVLLENKIETDILSAKDDMQKYTDTVVSDKADASHIHDNMYYTEAEMDSKLSAKSDKTHNHDTVYDTKGSAEDALTESKEYTDSVASGKANADHDHDSVYDAKGSADEVQSNLDTLSDEFNDHKNDSDIHVSSTQKTNWDAAYTHSQATHARTDATKTAKSSTNGNILINGTETNVYTHPDSGVTAGTYKSVTVNSNGHVTGGTNPTTLAGYGITDAESKGAASSAVSTHNTSTSAHNDIRDLIAGLTTRLNTLADSDDTTLDQMSEVVEYIKANKTLIDSVTTSKVNVSDIVNNLTTSVSNKPLSAAQGVAIKSLIDALQTAVDGKAASSHTHNYAGSSSAGGSANSAVKWSTARNINGMSVDGSANRTNYGTCSTAASTAAKTVACDGFSLITGAEITVKFTVSNTADSPTLNVNSTGAKPIYYRGVAITKTYLVANRTYTFRYDGTNWDFVGDINVDTNTDTKVTQTNTASTNADYRLLMSSTADDTSRAEAARKNTNLKYNPSTGVLSAPVFSGSVDASNINGVVPISKGGTDATTVAGAQENLGILTPDEIVNLYVWKKYAYTKIKVTNQTISLKNINTNDYDITYASEITIADGMVSLVDKQKITVTGVDDSNLDSIKGKYVSYVGAIYLISESATFSTVSTGTSTALVINLRVSSATKIVANTISTTHLEYVASKESDTYPSNGEHTDGYWYVYHKQLGE